MSRRFSLDAVWGRLYLLAVLLLLPMNLLAALVARGRFRPRSVVHIGELRHIQYYFVEELRRRDIGATYVAVGPGGWQWCDVHLRHLANPLLAALRDSWVLWRHVAAHEVVHCHCMMGVSHYQWDLLLLKLAGRRVVAHFRGCEARERARNLALHPGVNICRECDYAPAYLCEGAEMRRRRWFAARFADAVLVTTPDMRDFWPDALHLPFFPPPVPPPPPREMWRPGCGRDLMVFHVTNQPGIEATAAIRTVMERLRARGLPIAFNHMTGCSHDEVMAALAAADLTVGKLQMGYYANAQIEGMMMGVPAVTWVRDDLSRPELEEAGLILASLDGLEGALADLVAQPDRLAEATRRARAGILALHDPDTIVATLCRIYGWEAAQ